MDEHVPAPLPQHRFLRYAVPPKKRRVLREVAVSIMNTYSKTKQSRSKWLKTQAFRFRLTTLSPPDASGTRRKVEKTSEPIDIDAIEGHLESGEFDADAFGLPPLQCDWLDPSLVMSMDAPFLLKEGLTTAVADPNLGPAFPLRPGLDREGVAVSSFQNMSIQQVADARAALVEKSSSDQLAAWFQALRRFTAEAVSWIDGTLHQIYFKAQYDPLPGWKFDAARLGVRHGMMLVKKFAWIGKITGTPLNPGSELEEFNELRMLRNHLHHFDPPCFCCSMEDAVRWVNAVHGVARLNWRIRQVIGAALCPELIRLLLSPDVEFVPKPSDKPRTPQGRHSGYTSCTWPEAAKAE